MNNNLFLSRSKNKVQDSKSEMLREGLTSFVYLLEDGTKSKIRFDITPPLKITEEMD